LILIHSILLNYTGTYRFYNGIRTAEGGLNQVVRADRKVGGHIYSKGAPALADLVDAGDDGLKNLPAWTVFGLQMLPDASLNVFASCGEGSRLLSNHSNSLVQPGVWTNVTVVQDGLASRLFINGALDSEIAMPAAMQTPGKGAKALVFESAHPYADNLDQFTPVSVPGALSLTITFDALTSTEQTCDYVTLYKDSTCTASWGEERYSGKRASYIG
jgi:hypothetical protein